MPTYSMETQLPSCKVDKDLVRKLEKYVMRKLAEIESTDEGQLRSGYKFIMIDSDGSEEYQSVGQFQPEYFPDNITGLVLKYRTSIANRTSIREPDLSISFSQSRLASKFSMSIKDASSPRELVRDIRANILDMLNPHRTKNWLFKPSEPLINALMILNLFLYVTLMVYVIKENVIGALSLAAIQSCLLIPYLLMVLLIPHATIKTRKAELNADRNKWLVRVIIGVPFTIASGLLLVLIKVWLGW